MLSIEAVYENGVFRPLQPVELPEGARVGLITFPLEAPSDHAPDPVGLQEPLVGEELMALLKDIDSLPLGAPGRSSRTTRTKSGASPIAPASS